MTTMSTEVPAVDFNSFVFADGEILKTTSLIIAEKFGKEHKNVLRDIDVILTQVSDIFGKLNFELSEYEHQNNLGFAVKKPMYNITKDGLVMLVMGYTGAVAMKIKENYINAFNFMHKKLFEKPTIEKPIPMIVPCHPPLMTKDMQRHVEHLVGLAAKITCQTRHKVLKDLSLFFQADKWFLIPCDKYPDICAYFNVQPQYEQPILRSTETVTISADEYDFLRKSCQTPPDLSDTLTEFFDKRDSRRYAKDSEVIIERERLAELSVLAKVATSGHGDIFVA